jgi:hypothetical protein
MKTKAFILASVALFALGVSSAASGPCTTEIEGPTKTPLPRTQALAQPPEL